MPDTMNTIEMKKYNLPKQWLSFSQMDMFTNRREQYRREYYTQGIKATSPEMRYGSHIHKLIETNHDSVSHIPRYDMPEYKIFTYVDDVPILAFLDSYNSLTHEFIDYKTGKTKWTQKRVDELKQLPLYALLIDITTGSNENTLAQVVWIETMKQKGITLGPLKGGTTIECTGVVKIFDRTITFDEKMDTKEWVLKCAQEISNDFTKWQKRDTIDT